MSGPGTDGDAAGEPGASVDAQAIDADLVRRTWRLLQPGEIDLHGCIVHSDLDGSEETHMHQLTVDVGEVVADHAGHDPADTYVFSGTDDPEFASNQHQGLTLSDDEFVWECQQLLRGGSFDLVFYYEASADHEGILTTLREEGHRVSGVRGDLSLEAQLEGLEDP